MASLCNGGGHVCLCLVSSHLSLAIGCHGQNIGSTYHQYFLLRRSVIMSSELYIDQPQIYVALKSRVAQV